MSDLVAKASGHAEEFESVKSLQSLFVEHRRFSFLILVIAKLGVAYPFTPLRACVNGGFKRVVFFLRSFDFCSVVILAAADVVVGRQCRRRARVFFFQAIESVLQDFAQRFEREIGESAAPERRRFPDVLWGNVYLGAGCPSRSDSLALGGRGSR